MVTSDGTGLVFIVSTPRAGSTLLGAILGSHSKLLCPPEPWILLPLVGMRDDRILATSAFDQGMAMRALREFVPRPLFDECVRTFACTAYNELLREANKDIFVDKTPRYYHILPSLDALFPGALQIWLRRNPLDTVASFIDTWQLKLDELLGETITPYTFDVTIGFQQLSAHFAAPNGQKLVVGYEDFVREPEPFIRHICGGLGIEFEPEMLEYGRNDALVGTYRRASMGDKKVLESATTHARSVHRWRDILSTDDVSRIVRTLGSAVFERTGYSDLLDEALIYARLDGASVTPDGRMEELGRAYQAYSVDKESLDQGGDSARPDLQYTLLGRRTSELQKIADERLTLIERLHEQLHELRSEVEAKEQVIAELQSASDERLRLIHELTDEIENLRAATGVDAAWSPQQGVEVGVASEQEAVHWLDATLTTQALHDIVAQQRGSISQLRSDIQVLRGLRALDSQTVLEARVQVLGAARDSATALAATRLRIIEDQRREIQAFRRGRPFERIRHTFAPRLGVLYQYPPRPLHVPARYSNQPQRPSAIRLSMVTPSLDQGAFIERTIRSVLDQNYTSLEYIVQDGGSTDGTLGVLERYSGVLSFVESIPDDGFGNAINRGFEHATGEIMCYLNSDDVLLPGGVHHVMSYFERHPQVDVVYGHRAVIDEYDAEIGRWVLPPHNDEILSWADYVPQETLFWRRRIWDKCGGAIDESFRFAIDWDLLLRFRDAGAKMVRLPRFLGGFRVHPHQKTSSELQEIGVVEMNRLRERCHGRSVMDWEVSRAIAPYLRRHVWYHQLYRIGLLRH